MALKFCEPQSFHVFFFGFRSSNWLLILEGQIAVIQTAPNSNDFVPFLPTPVAIRITSGAVPLLDLNLQMKNNFFFWLRNFTNLEAQLHDLPIEISVT